MAVLNVICTSVSFLVFAFLPLLLATGTVTSVTDRTVTRAAGGGGLGLLSWMTRLAEVTVPRAAPVPGVESTRGMTASLSPGLPSLAIGIETVARGGVGTEGDRLLEGGDIRAAGTGDDDGQGAGEVAGAGEGDRRRAVGDVGREAGGGELKDGTGGLDGQRRCAGAAEQSAAGGIGETQVDGLGARGVGVVENGDRDALGARVAGGPAQGLGLRGLVHAGLRGAVAGSDLDRDRAGAAAGASPGS